eukprot:scaffold46147_cov53-Attheya_sp.AAC.1
MAGVAPKLGAGDGAPNDGGAAAGVAVPAPPKAKDAPAGVAPAPASAPKVGAGDGAPNDGGAAAGVVAPAPPNAKEGPAGVAEAPAPAPNAKDGVAVTDAVVVAVAVAVAGGTPPKERGAAAAAGAGANEIPGVGVCALLMDDEAPPKANVDGAAVGIGAGVAGAVAEAPPNENVLGVAADDEEGAGVVETVVVLVVDVNVDAAEPNEKEGVATPAAPGVSAATPKETRLDGAVAVGAGAGVLSKAEVVVAPPNEKAGLDATVLVAGSDAAAVDVAEDEVAPKEKDDAPVAAVVVEGASTVEASFVPNANVVEGAGAFVTLEDGSVAVWHPRRRRQAGRLSLWNFRWVLFLWLERYLIHSIPVVVVFVRRPLLVGNVRIGSRDGNVSDTPHEDVERDPAYVVLVVVPILPMQMVSRKNVEWESPNHVDFVSMWVLLVVVAVSLFHPDVSFHTRKQVECLVSWELLLRTC